MTGILYISYDGMLEPLGQSQVLAYLEKLASAHVIDLISFEKAEDWRQVEQREALRERIAAGGIRWHPLRYHKRPSALATAWDIVRGTARGIRLVYQRRLTVVHARSYVPSVMALVIKRLSGAHYLFDMRGFWADERVDGGLWPRGGLMFRMAKWFERHFLLRADHVVSLTNAAVRELQAFSYLQGRMPPVTVIPTCADLARFRPARERPPEGFVLGYVGSAGNWHMFDGVTACFRQLLAMRPDARLLIINRNEHGFIAERLAAAGIPAAAVTLKAARHADIPGEMSRMHAGIFFYTPSYSRIACSPTKLGEFLGCGLPCLSNTGVGDMTGILQGERVGATVDAFDKPTLEVALEKLIGLSVRADTAGRCVAAAQRHFSLERGVARYDSIYRALAQSRG